jgi:hypothetical protein
MLCDLRAQLLLFDYQTYHGRGRLYFGQCDGFLFSFLNFLTFRQMGHSPL